MLDKARLEARQESLAEIGEIASRMAHEIRNPLNAIRMQVAVIRNKLLKPDAQNLEVAKGQLERLEVEVLRVEKLAKAFLEFGRPPADEPEDVCLLQLVDDVVALVRPEFEEAGHVLTFESNGGADLWVHMDRAKLRQVLLNLLSNARNAMNSRGRVQVGLHREGEAYASIQIEDTGCGIQPEDLADIFLPFHSPSATGEGLGLPISKKIVEAVGGCIRVQSQVSRGSCFEVVLPLEMHAAQASGA
jgi:signal transduction histidine kinase